MAFVTRLGFRGRVMGGLVWADLRNFPCKILLNDEYLLMCLLATHISSLMQYIFKSLPHFKNICLLITEL